MIKKKIVTYDTTSVSTNLSRKNRFFKFDDKETIDLKMFLKHKSWTYFNEMQCYLFDDWNIFCDVFIIFKILKKHKINRKIIQKKISKKSQICRNDYMFIMSKFQNHQLCYFDESATNEHITYRKFDWVFFDITFKIIRFVKRNERHNILFCYDKNEMICCHIYQKSIDEFRFEWFFQNEIFFRCNSYSNFKSIFIMNNVSIHRHAIRQIAN